MMYGDMRNMSNDHPVVFTSYDSFLVAVQQVLADAGVLPPADVAGPDAEVKADRAAELLAGKGYKTKAPQSMARLAEDLNLRRKKKGGVWWYNLEDLKCALVVAAGIIKK